MPDEGSLDPKSPKTPRRVKTPLGAPTRHVHFEQTTADKTFASAVNVTGGNYNPAATATSPAPTAAASTAATGGDQAKPAASTQPTAFPGLVPPAGLSACPWYTSANPAQSISALHQLHPGQNLAGYNTVQTPNFPATYVYHPNQQQPAQVINMAADYSNTAPPIMGVNFQPPVPDTTHGPMNHIYFPRFDNGVVGGGPGIQQVGYSPLTFPHLYPFTTAPTTFMSPVSYNWRFPNILAPTGFMGYQPSPKTFYAYSYHQQPAFGQNFVQAQQVPQGYFLQPQLQQQAQFQPQPVYHQQPPLLVNGQPSMMPAPGPQLQAAPASAFVQVGAPAMGGQQLPFNIGGAGAGAGAGPIPDIAGLGRTQGEETIRQLNFAHNNGMFKAQDFKPSDDDPSRFYYVRELDGNWTQRNRFTIDHMGDCRWYLTDEGWLYAVRLPN